LQPTGSSKEAQKSMSEGLRMRDARVERELGGIII
jgi:hypothetical protein